MTTSTKGNLNGHQNSKYPQGLVKNTSVQNLIRKSKNDSKTLFRIYEIFKHDTQKQYKVILSVIFLNFVISLKVERIESSSVACALCRAKDKACEQMKHENQALKERLESYEKNNHNSLLNNSSENLLLRREESNNGTFEDGVSSFGHCSFVHTRTVT